MPKASVKRLIECKKDQLIDLVLDIEKYPEFVPFCYAAKIHETVDEKEPRRNPFDFAIFSKSVNSSG